MTLNYFEAIAFKNTQPWAANCLTYPFTMSNIATPVRHYNLIKVMPENDLTRGLANMCTQLLLVNSKCEETAAKHVADYVACVLEDLINSATEPHSKHVIFGQLLAKSGASSQIIAQIERLMQTQAMRSFCLDPSNASERLLLAKAVMHSIASLVPCNTLDFARILNAVGLFVFTSGQESTSELEKVLFKALEAKSSALQPDLGNCKKDIYYK